MPRISVTACSSTRILPICAAFVEKEEDRVAFRWRAPRDGSQDNADPRPHERSQRFELVMRQA